MVANGNMTYMMERLCASRIIQTPKSKMGGGITHDFTRGAGYFLEVMIEGLVNYDPHFGVMNHKSVYNRYQNTVICLIHCLRNKEKGFVKKVEGIDIRRNGENKK